MREREERIPRRSRGRVRTSALDAASDRQQPLRVLHVAAELLSVGQDRRARRCHGGAAAGAGGRRASMCGLCLPGFPALLDAFRARPTSPGCARRSPPSGCGSRWRDLPGSEVAGLSRRSSGILRPAGQPLCRRRTGATGPTITAASRCSAGSRRRWRRAPTPTGGPTSCMATIGMPGSRRPICAPRGSAGAERLHRAQPRLSGLLPGRRASPIWRCRRASSRSTASSSTAGCRSSRPGCSTPTG